MDAEVTDGFQRRVLLFAHVISRGVINLHADVRDISNDEYRNTRH